MVPTPRADFPLGDPYDYSVLLWTRVYPTDAFRIDIPQCVTYKVYDGENGTGKVVSEGYALTGPDVDYTVKVSATPWAG
jgi:alkaline phosphatase D